MRAMINGESLPNSNIVDIFGHMFHGSKSLAPTGYSEFISGLKTLNIPISLLPSKVAKEIQSQSGEGIRSFLKSHSRSKHHPQIPPGKRMHILKLYHV